MEVKLISRKQTKEEGKYNIFCRGCFAWKDEHTNCSLINIKEFQDKDGDCILPYGEVFDIEIIEGDDNK